jgi:hypothetical protein
MTGEEDGLAEEREVCLHVSRKMLVSSLIYMPLLLRLLFFFVFFLLLVTLCVHMYGAGEEIKGNYEVMMGLLRSLCR